MPNRIIYIPIEPYKARSTEYMSVENGVYETGFKKLGITVRPIRPDHRVREIKTGVVVDVRQRAEWGFTQINELIYLLQNGNLDPKQDVIYFEDLWTPGFEMIPYAQSAIFGTDQDRHVPVYGFCHAQSTDPNDFTWPWSYWMRDMEKGWYKYMTGIICACKEMVDQFSKAGMPQQITRKMHVCGLAFDAAVMRRVAEVDDLRIVTPRMNRVVFSSRWDTEKDPVFFLKLAKAFAEDPEWGRKVMFVVATGHTHLMSNCPGLIAALEEAVQTFGNIQVQEGLSKAQYYRLLQSSKVQFNCADQDFISYTLLDALVCGCLPLYPEFLTFPDALDNDMRFLYKKRDLANAKYSLEVLLKSDAIDVSSLYAKYEKSVHRMVKAMGFNV